MKLSVILIAYNMRREITRALQSLSRGYQKGAEQLEYEVILVDNGSSEPVDQEAMHALDVPVRYVYVENAHPSPAQAVNDAVAMASGEVVCLMVDGAHLLTPGAFELALSCFRAFDEPVVATRYFFLGPDEQNDSIATGYDKPTEDKLLAQIDWPNDGYRLFEIGTPLWLGANKITWLHRMFESNCLFMRKSLFEVQGGIDTRFSYPGGGFLNLDIYKRCCDTNGVTPVQLVGEGSFHQLHGGTTTNVTPEDRKKKTEKYRQQYIDIRGNADLVSDKDLFFLGHLPTKASKIHVRNRPKRNDPQG